METRAAMQSIAGITGVILGLLGTLDTTPSLAQERPSDTTSGTDGASSDGSGEPSGNASAEGRPGSAPPDSTGGPAAGQSVAEPSQDRAAAEGPPRANGGSTAASAVEPRSADGTPENPTDAASPGSEGQTLNPSGTLPTESPGAPETAPASPQESTDEQQGQGPESQDGSTEGVSRNPPQTHPEGTAPPSQEGQVTVVPTTLLESLASLAGRSPSPEAPRSTKSMGTSSGDLRDLVPGLPAWARGNVPQSLGLLLVFLLLAYALRRTRRALPRQGLVPLLTLGLSFLVRIGLVSAVLLLLAAIFRPFAEGAYPWFLAAAAIATGWSLRDVLPDVAAAITIRLENRIKPGVWISSDRYEGVVERRAIRALWLRDPYGDRLAIPNRQILSTTLRIQEDSGAIHDVALRLPSNNEAESLDAAATRQGILEAVLTSPYVAAEANPAIRRDGEEPDVWRVRARLLHERYAVHFEGELLERVYGALATVQGESSPEKSNRSKSVPPASEPPAAG